MYELMQLNMFARVHCASYSVVPAFDSVDHLSGQQPILRAAKQQLSVYCSRYKIVCLSAMQQLVCHDRWVEEYHVDGFRFDLASCLCRDSQGNPLEAPPIIRDIAKDPVLSKVEA